MIDGVSQFFEYVVFCVHLDECFPQGTGKVFRFSGVGAECFNSRPCVRGDIAIAIANVLEDVSIHAPA